MPQIPFAYDVYGGYGSVRHDKSKILLMVRRVLGQFL